MAPVAGSGGTALFANVELYGSLALVYAVGANGQVTAYTELGAVQTDPSATDNINSPATASAVAYDPVSNSLMALQSGSLNTYAYNGGSVGTFAPAGMTLAPGVLTWDPFAASTFAYDTTSSKLVQMAGTLPTAATLNGSAQASPYVALVSAQMLTQTELYAATASTITQISAGGAVLFTFPSPGVGTIAGLAYDPNSKTLFVAGSSGVAYWSNLDLTPGAPTVLNSGITAATAIAFDKYSGLVYVAQSDGFVHVYTESGAVAGGKFDLLGGATAINLIVAP